MKTYLYLAMLASAILVLAALRPVIRLFEEPAPHRR